MSANMDLGRRSPALARLACAVGRLAWRFGRVAWLALAAAAWAQGGAPIPVADFSAAPASGMYGYASSTPGNLADLVDPRRPRPAATVRAQWLLPAGGGAKLPAVVLVHGSGGVYPELATFWARRLNEQGIAALIIDIFGPRGVSSTVEDQSQVPFAADVADAFAALRLASTHPRIDASRIAIMGFSRGGTAAWRTAVGASVEGDRGARDAAARAVDALLKRVFGL